MASQVEASPDWWDSDWQYRQKLTFSNSGLGPLSNFPVLVHLSGSCGKGGSDLSGLFDGKTQDNGEDIRFVDSDDTTPLPYEIEEWDNPGQEAWIWVKVPTIDNSNTDYIYMYYGNLGAADEQNPTAVWNNNYKMVQHLKDKTTSITEDSTSNNNDGAKKGANDPNEVDGKIYKGQNFVGTNHEWIRVTYSAEFQPAHICLEAWIKFDSSEPATTLVSKLDSAAGYGLYQAYLAADWIEWYIVDTTSATYQQARFPWSEISPPTPTEWHYIVGTYDGDAVRIFLDGNLKDTNYTPSGPIDYKGFTPDLFIAADPNGNSPSTPSITGFDGQMDEVRISDIACSADWIKAQYDSMDDNFITFGGEEKRPVVGGTVYPIDKVSILMPWIGMAVALALAGVFITRFARRRVRG